MKKQLVRVYEYNSKCIDFGDEYNFYYTLPDFGDSPKIMKCKNCGELYFYDPNATVYMQPLEEQIQSITCEKCFKDLKETLVPTHKNIICCGNEFSLDDNFDANRKYNDPTFLINIYDLYS